MKTLTKRQIGLADWFNLLIDNGATKEMLEKKYKPKDKDNEQANGFYRVYKLLTKHKLINVEKMKGNLINY